MRYNYEFETADERDKIISDNPELTLIEEQITFEGKFVILSDDPENDLKKNVMIPISEEEFKSIKQRQDATDAAILQLMTEGMV